MSLHVNFVPHGKDLGDAHRAVLDNDDPTNWLVYSFEKGTTDLRVQGTGDGGLEELYDEFSDSKMQFAFARVIDPNTELPKFVFIAWCGSGVPETRKGFFNSYLNDVSKFFKSFHVQINARDEADVEPALIMKRVAESSGAKYSVHKEQARPQPAVTPVNSVYKKTEIPDIAAMQRQTMRQEGPPPPVGTSYKPVQTAPKPLASRWNPQTQQDSGASSVRLERERAEREAREREEQFARERLQREQETEKERLRQEQEAESRRKAAEAAQIEARQRAEQAAEEQRAARRTELERQQREAQEAAAREAAAREAAARETAEREAAEAQRRREEEAREAENRRLRTQQEEQQRQEEERRKQQEAQRYEQEQAALQAQREAASHHAVNGSNQAIASATDATHSTRGISAVVLYDYDAAEENEMTLVEGEIITQIDTVDEGWWFGVSENGKKQGLFPANYVEILEEQPQEEKQVVQPQPPKSPTPPKEDLGHYAIALYDYDAGEDNEISFKENQRITHIEFVSEDWWQGVAPDGKSVGLFPANYVELQNP